MRRLKFWNRTRRVDIQVSLLTAVIAIISSFCVFGVAYRMTYNEMIRSLEDRVTSIHSYMEDALDKSTFFDINRKGDQQKESYREMKLIFDHVKNISGVRYLYTAKKNDDGEFIYIIDGLDLNAPDFRYPGDPIEHEIWGDMQRALSGEVVLPNNIKNTDWGKIFITYFPMHHEGKVVGVLGIEFEASRQYMVYQSLLGVVPLIALLICVLSAAAAMAIFKRISNPTYQDMSNTDQLTQLKNRNAFEIDLANLETLRDKTGIGIVSADLNNLKKVNDVLGHGKGDIYIQHAAQALRDAVLNKAAIYRVGGDEYVVLSRNATAEDLDAYIGRVLEAFENLHLEGGIHPSLSIGSALYNAALDPDVASVCRRADESMYHQKKKHHQKHEDSGCSCV